MHGDGVGLFCAPPRSMGAHEERGFHEMKRKETEISSLSLPGGNMRALFKMCMNRKGNKLDEDLFSKEENS